MRHGQELSSPAVLAVRRLTLTRFRSYGGLRLDLDSRPVALSGPNGAGKTNLLEAVSFLTPGRGLRNARLLDVQQINAAAEGWAVAARLDGLGGPVEIGVGVEHTPRDGERERRLTRIDGEPARSQTALAQHALAIWLTPQMDRLFLDSAGTRRRFIDRLVFGFDPLHAARLSRYEHAMRERARLLRDRILEPAWLGSLEEQMATSGVAVAAARRDVAAQLTRAAARGVGPFPGAWLTLEGQVDDWIAAGPALAAEDMMRQELLRTRNHDGAAVGPHRSDLAVRHVARDMPAALCSTGEQKALLIAIILANARLLAADRGAAPLLLLDEVAAHLDAERREALFAEVLALGAQAWLTGVDDAVFAPLGAAAQRFCVAEGRVTAMM